MADRTKMYLLGPGTLALDSVDVGYVSQAKLSITSKLVEAKTSAYGDGVLDTFDVGAVVKLTVMFDELAFANYVKAITAATRNTSGSDENMSMGRFVGGRQTSMLLDFVPRSSAISTLLALKAWRVVPSGNRDLDLGIDKTQSLNVEFTFLIDESKTDNEKYFRFGNVSVSADTTAPTLSSIAPTDGQTLAAPATIVLTFNEALNPATVNGGNITVYNYTDESLVAGTLSLNAAGTVVTFTPTVTLSGSKVYITSVSPGLLNASNIAFGGDVYKFTTS